MLAAILFLFFQKLFNKEIAYSIILVVVLIYLGIVIYLRSKLVYYLMYYYYFTMLIDNIEPKTPYKKLYTSTWLKQFSEKGFEKTMDNDDFVIYHKFYDKIPKFGRTGRVLIAFVVSKNEAYDFYDLRVNDQIENIYQNYKYQKRVKKQLIIHFKKYQNYEEKLKEELTHIINFKNGDYVYINLPIGYFVSENKVYFLRPKKKFPNKYYYYAVQLANDYSYIKDE